VVLPPGRARFATKPAPDWVDNCHKHDWRCASRPLQRLYSGRTSGQDDLRYQRHQFCREIAIAISIAPCPTNFDLYVPLVGPTEFLQRLSERSYAGLRFLVFGQVHENADASLSVRLLCTRSKRPNCRYASEQRNEIAPSH
jgi:hypothetical protein